MFFIRKVLLYLLFLGCSALIMYTFKPEVQDVRMMDKTYTQDIRVPLWDLGDKVFVRASRDGEGMENFTKVSLFVMWVVLLMQSIALVVQIFLNNRREEDFYKSKAWVLSFLGWQLIAPIAVTLISLIALWSVKAYFVAHIIIGIVYVVGIIGTVTVYLEDDESLFNGYESFSEYFLSQYKYNIEIEGLTHLYKNQIK